MLLGWIFSKKIHPKIMSVQKRLLMEEEFVLEITVRIGVDEPEKNAICREKLFSKMLELEGSAAPIDRFQLQKVS